MTAAAKTMAAEKAITEIIAADPCLDLILDRLRVHILLEI
jgi:hypothetical protein